MQRRRINPAAAGSIALFLLLGGGVCAWLLLAGRHYYLLSLLVLLAGFALLALGWEHWGPSAAEIVVLSVLCAAAVAGRALFAPLPACKPVIAIVILTGVEFGAGAGFLCGAMTAFVSNFLFGQGPWTPGQMFAYGVAGFLAGLLSRWGVLPKRRVPLTVFGAVVVVVCVGPLLDTCTVLLLDRPTWAAAGLIYLAGVPFNLLHGAATAVFLALLAPVLIEKLERVKVKYGLLPPEEWQ